MEKWRYLVSSELNTSGTSSVALVATRFGKAAQYLCQPLNA